MSLLHRKIKSEDVIESYSEILPMAAHRAVEFLNNVEASIEDQQLPVRRRAQQGTSSLGGRAWSFSVFQPEANALKKFKILLFAEPMGRNLAVGWLVVGDGARFGRPVLSVPFLDEVELLENLDLRAIVQSIHQHSVLPFVRDFLLSENYDPALARTTARGILGI